MKITLAFLLLIGTIFQFEQSNAEEISLPTIPPLVPSYYDIFMSGVKYSLSSAYSEIENGAKSSVSYVHGLWSTPPSPVIPTGVKPSVPSIPSVTDAI